MSDVQNRVPLPDVDPAKVAYIHSLMREQGLPIPIRSAVPAMPAAPESPEQKIGRLFTERGYPKGMPNQSSCWSPLDIAAREQIAREVYSEYQPTNTGTDTTRVTLPQPTTETEARELLRSAVAKLQVAEQAVTEAAGIVDTTRMRLDQLNSQLAEYGDLDEQITSHSVKDMRVHGEVTALPYNLERGLADRQRLRDRVDQYSMALQRLQQSQREQEQQATQAKLACSQCALEVLNIRVSDIADRIEQYERLAKELRMSLLSFSRLWLQGQAGPRAVHLSQRVVNLLHTLPEPADADPDMITLWRQHHAALMLSSEAALD